MGIFSTDVDRANPWALYDRLISGVSEDALIRDYTLGTRWSYVEAECGMGVAWTHRGGGKRVCQDDLRGKSLRSVAELSKSWNFEEATIGVAALNAWYSRRDLLDPLGASFDDGVPAYRREQEGAQGRRTNMSMSIFEQYRSDVEALDDPHVVVVGHFPKSEDISDYAHLTILERNCRDGWDTPDPACEYALPEADFAFITGTALINKTMPRLLELSQQARVSLLGPSVIMTPHLFDWGVETLSGSVVVDPEKTRFIAKTATGKLFDGALDMCTLHNEQ